jgi:2,3-bisphosphoglycerate-dependent phosphoglycerate mutase
MANLILVRHGQSAGNRDRIFAMDPHSLPLTELGYAQARAAARIIAEDFDAHVVISSPFVRARETARTIADALHLPVAVEPNLYERDVGAHKGLTYDSLEGAPDYDTLRPWAWRPREGESYLDVQARVAPILDRLAAEHPSEDVVIVSHGGVMMTLWAHVTGDWEAAPIAPNCGLIVVAHGPQGYGAPQIIDSAAL